MKHGTLLTILIIAGLVAGALFGEFVLFDQSSPIDDSHWTKTVGDLVLIRPLKLMIIPLVFVSVVAGVTSIGDPSKLGIVGGTTIVYYLATMLLAVTLGAALVTAIQPGELPAEQKAKMVEAGEQSFESGGALRANVESARDAGKDNLGGAWLNILKQMIPTNIFNEMAQSRTLGVIVTALLFGLAIASGGTRAEPVRIFFDSMFDVLMRLVGWIIWLTPIGVFFLVAWTVGKIGVNELTQPIGKYMLTVVVGLFIHGFIVLPFILLIFGRTNPFAFLWQMRRTMGTAFGTDSSSATLPVTIDNATNEGGCSKRSANFVLPLGSTINMDGTALYEAVAVVFLFQLYGIELGFAELLVVVVTATLAAIGAAGIPSAGLVTMVIVISAVNQSLGNPDKVLPLEAIGVIVGVDRMLDMCRTMVNVWGDAVGAKLMTRLAPDPPPAKVAAAATAPVGSGLPGTPNR